MIKLLSLLLFVVQIPTLTFASSKVTQYFALGTSLKLNTQKTKFKNNQADTKFSNLYLHFAKGYIFNKHFDVAVGLHFIKEEAKEVDGNKPKNYAADVAVKYLFNKYNIAKRHYHNDFIVPYVGLGLKWSRFSPHTEAGQVAKTTKLSSVVSVGLRYFITSNLAIAGDVSYSDTKGSTRTSSTKTAQDKSGIDSHINLTYFY